MGSLSSGDDNVSFIDTHETICYLMKEGFNVIAELAVQSKELSHSHALRPLLKAHKKSKMKEYVKSIQQKK